MLHGQHGDPRMHHHSHSKIGRSTGCMYNGVMLSKGRVWRMLCARHLRVLPSTKRPLLNVQCITSAYQRWLASRAQQTSSRGHSNYSAQPRRSHLWPSLQHQCITSAYKDGLLRELSRLAHRIKATSAQPRRSHLWPPLQQKPSRSKQGGS